MSQYFNDLTLATRDYFDKMLVRLLSYQTPVFSMMAKNKKIRKGGLLTAKDIKSAHTLSLVNNISSNDPLLGGRKDTLSQGKWGFSISQHPMEKTLVQNIMNAPKGDTQLVDIAAELATDALEAMRLNQAILLWCCHGDTDFNTYETVCQGIPSACLPTNTYGTINRSTAANAFWKSADSSNIFTHYNLSKAKLYEWLDEAAFFTKEGEKLYVVLGTTLYRRLIVEFEAGVEYTVEGDSATQGFNSIKLNHKNAVIMEDPILDLMCYGSVIDKSTGSSMKTLVNGSGQYTGLMGQYQYDLGSEYQALTGANVVVILNSAGWEFRHIPNPLGADGSTADDGYCTITPFTFQGHMENGRMKWLAQLLMFRNVICDRPNVQLYRGNVH